MSGPSGEGRPGDIERRPTKAEAHLAAIAASSPDALISADLHGVILSWSPGAERMFGYTADEAIGRPVSMISPADGLEMQADFRRRAARGEIVQDVLTWRVHKDGHQIPCSLTLSIIHNEHGTPIAFSGILRDSSDRLRAEEDLRRSLQRQQQLVEILESTPDFVAIADLDGSLRFVNAAGRALAGLPESGNLEGIRALDLIPGRLKAAFADVIVPHAAEHGTWSGESLIARPDGSEIPVSQVIVSHRDASGNVEYFSTIARDISERKAAEEAARRHDEQQRRSRFERTSTERLQALNDALIAINRVVSQRTTMQVVAEQAGRIIGARQAFAVLLTDDRRGASAAAAVLAQEYGEYRSLEADPSAVFVYAAEMGDSPAVRFDEQQLRADPRWDLARSARPELPPLRGLLAAALTTSDGTRIGAIILSDKADEQAFTETDLAALIQLAQMSSIALDKAGRYEREHKVASTLQSSFLPERLPHLDNLLLAARYTAGGTGVEVGGDWYDALELDGRRIALIIGDVEGHGIRSAGVMGQLRNTVRAYAWESFEPAEALSRLNDLVERIGEGHFSTVLFALLEPSSGRMTFASAGHPPPLRIGPGGTGLIYSRANPPIGAMSGATYLQTSVQVEPGDTLLFYTDGLIESRTRPLDLGFAALIEVASRHDPADVHGLIDSVLAGVPDPAQQDDIAVLVVHLSLHPSMHLEIPAEPSSLAPLRGKVRGFLEQCGLDGEDVFDLVLACSEAAANAIEHPIDTTRRFIEVSVRCETSAAWIEVRDFGAWRQPKESADRGRGLRIIDSVGTTQVKQTGDGTRLVIQRSLHNGGKQ